MEEENKIEANTLASSDKRKEILISLNTNENQEESN
jgi:predicted transcriptional regulator